MSESDDDDTTCPCKKVIPNSQWILCNTCKEDWHIACCGLKGLTQSPIRKLEANGWKCPRCYKLPDDVPPLGNTELIQAAPISQDTIQEIVAVVTSTVEENLKTMLSPVNTENEETEENTGDGVTIAYIKY